MSEPVVLFDGWRMRVTRDPFDRRIHIMVWGEDGRWITAPMSGYREPPGTLSAVEHLRDALTDTQAYFDTLPIPQGFP